MISCIWKYGMWWEVVKIVVYFLTLQHLLYLMVSGNLRYFSLEYSISSCVVKIVVFANYNIIMGLSEFHYSLIYGCLMTNCTFFCIDDDSFSFNWRYWLLLFYANSFFFLCLIVATNIISFCGFVNNIMKLFGFQADIF